MKKEEPQVKTRKPRQNTVHLALVLVAVLVVVIAIANVATEGQDGITGKAIADPADPKTQLADTIDKKLNRQAAPSTPDGEVLLNEEFSMSGKNYPVIKTLKLEEGARYTVFFETDKLIQFVVYSEKYYQSWRDSGLHSIAKATTQSGFDCCKTSGSYNFDVNIGEGGNFYFVFDDMKIPDKNQLPSKAKLMVMKNENI